MARSGRCAGDGGLENQRAGFLGGPQRWGAQHGQGLHRHGSGQLTSPERRGMARVCGMAGKLGQRHGWLGELHGRKGGGAANAVAVNRVQSLFIVSIGFRFESLLADRRAGGRIGHNLQTIVRSSSQTFLGTKAPGQSTFCADVAHVVAHVAQPGSEGPC